MLAISALVLSGIMLVLGIGQVTFLAGPHKVSYSESFTAPEGLAMIDAQQFSAMPGQSNVVLSGEGAVVAVGNVRDVQAWLAPFSHAEVTANAKTKTLELKTVAEDRDAAKEYAELIDAKEGEKVEPPSPFGSDLWLEQRGVDPVATKKAAEDTASESESEPQAAAVATDKTAESSGAQTVRLPLSLEADQAVLVSTTNPSAGDKISIEWVQDRRTPWAGPLLVGGGALALIGALLYLLAVDHDRRGLGPRRGRRGPLQGIRNVLGRSGRKSQKGATTGKATNESAVKSRRTSARTMQRRTLVPALAVTAALALSGCAPSYWPDFSSGDKQAEQTERPAAPATGAPVPVLPAQVSRIVADIASLAGVADDNLDTAGLEARFTGDALVEREANYTIRKAVADYEVVVPRITDEELGYQLVQSTENWPRTIFVVVASQSDAAPADDAAPAEGEAAAETGADALTDETQKADEPESPSLALIMTQKSPHENFLVSRTIALRGGISMPEAAPAEEGTALLADDMQTLALSPAEVTPAYAAVLAGGPEAPEAKSFDLEGDSLIERSGAAWVAQSTAAAAAGGQGINYSVTATQSDAATVNLSTGVGGALVASTILESRVEAPAADSRWRPTVPKSLAALSGLEGQQDMLVSVVAHQLLFFIPSKSSNDKIQLLGYTSDLISASNS